MAQTRPVVNYDRRPDGYRYIETVEVAVDECPRECTCSRCKRFRLMRQTKQIAVARK
jgi:hypothetical protein